MKTPVVSVVMGCFNHGKFVDAAIESVLGQTFGDFELIIVDDCSDDETRAHAECYRRDSRVQLVALHKRSGPSMAFCAGVERASGKYLAIFSGDDVCLPGRLQVQVNILEQGYGEAVFSVPEVIDSTGRFDQLKHLRFSKMFVPPTKEETVLGKLFQHGNFLCAPSAMLHTKLFQEIKGFHRGLFQLQDFYAWIRLAAIANVIVLDTPLVQYRVRDDDGNLSHYSQMVRVHNELQYCYRHFFDGMDRGILLSKLPRAMCEAMAKGEDLPLDVEVSLLLAAHEKPAVQILGLHGLLDALEHGEIANRLARIGIDQFTLYRQLGEIDTFGTRAIGTLVRALPDQGWPQKLELYGGRA